MSTIFDFYLKDQGEEVVEIPAVVGQQESLDGWDEQTYFYDESVKVTSYPIVTLRQQRMSEAFTESCNEDRKRRRVMRMVYWFGFAVAFVAGITFGVLWIGGVYSTVEGLLLCSTAVAVNFYCLLHAGA